MPRGARPLISARLPHGREAVAAAAVLVVLAHLLLAQLTLVLAVAFVMITRLSRWRLWWLGVPGAAGLALALALGPGLAAAGFTAGPAQILGYLGRGSLLARMAHPQGLFAWSASWLPRQLPIALLAGSAEAMVIGWLDWARTGKGALAPRRPGLVAVLRGALAARMISSGAVVTRRGCALGVVAATGAVAELRWSQLAGGALVTGASAQEATVTSLQVVHAALRRRKPLVVIDTRADASIARAIDAACRATGTPLRLARTDLAGTGRAGADLAGADLTGADLASADLASVIGERAAALITPRSPELAARACADLMALAADLHRIGVDGDALVWVPGGERLPARSLAALIGAGGDAGLAVLISTASPAAATELAGLVGALLIHRIDDPALAAALAAQTGPRRRPAAEAAALAVQPAGAVAGSPLAGPALPGPALPGTARAGTPGVAPDLSYAMPGAGLVPYPAVTARTLLALGPGQFVLAVIAPGTRPERGRLVLAPLPVRAAGDAGDRDTDAQEPQAREAQARDAQARDAQARNPQGRNPQGRAARAGGPAWAVGPPGRAGRS